MDRPRRRRRGAAQLYARADRLGGGLTRRRDRRACSLRGARSARRPLSLSRSRGRAPGCRAVRGGCDALGHHHEPARDRAMAAGRRPRAAQALSGGGRRRAGRAAQGPDRPHRPVRAADRGDSRQSRGAVRGGAGGRRGARRGAGREALSPRHEARSRGSCRRLQSRQPVARSRSQGRCRESLSRRHQGRSAFHRCALQSRRSARRPGPQQGGDHIPAQGARRRSRARRLPVQHGGAQTAAGGPWRGGRLLAALSRGRFLVGVGGARQARPEALRNADQAFVMTAKSKREPSGKAKRAPAKTSLREYERKRDFSKTSEPAPAPGADLGGQFVVQMHAARRLHYDLRLELDGVLKSWAVPNGPSLIADKKRLAVQTEDHPMQYLEFEGNIPRGEYGGGAMIVWDRGRWVPEGDPHFGLDKGHLAFALEGRRLKGRWHLVRMKPRRGGGKRPEWLFIKVDDAFGRPAGQGDITGREATW